MPLCGQGPQPPSVFSHHAVGAGGSWAGVAAAAAWAVLPIAILLGSPAMAAEDLSTGPLKAAAQKGNVPRPRKPSPFISLLPSICSHFQSLSIVLCYLTENAGPANKPCTCLLLQPSEANTKWHTLRAG